MPILNNLNNKFFNDNLHEVNNGVTEVVEDTQNNNTNDNTHDNNEISVNNSNYIFKTEDIHICDVTTISKKSELYGNTSKIGTLYSTSSSYLIPGTYINDTDFSKAVENGLIVNVNGINYCITDANGNIVLSDNNLLRIIELSSVNSFDYIYSINKPAYFAIKPEYIGSNFLRNDILSYSYLVEGKEENIGDQYFTYEETQTYTYNSKFIEINADNKDIVFNEQYSYVVSYNYYPIIGDERPSLYYQYDVVLNNNYVDLSLAYEIKFIENENCITDNYSKIENSNNTLFVQDALGSYVIDYDFIACNAYQIVNNVNYKTFIYDGSTYVEIQKPCYDISNISEYSYQTFVKYDSESFVGNKPLYIHSTYLKINIDDISYYKKNGDIIYKRSSHVEGVNGTLDNVDFTKLYTYKSNDTSYIIDGIKKTIQKITKEKSEVAEDIEVDGKNISVLNSLDEYKLNNIYDYIYNIEGYYKVVDSENYDENLEYFVKRKNYVKIGTTKIIKDKAGNVVDAYLQLDYQLSDDSYFFINKDDISDLGIDVFYENEKYISHDEYDSFISYIKTAGNVVVYRTINDETYEVNNKTGIINDTFYIGIPKYIETQDRVANKDKKYFYKSENPLYFFRAAQNKCSNKQFEYLYDNSYNVNINIDKNTIEYTYVTINNGQHIYKLNKVDSTVDPLTASFAYTKYLYKDAVINSGIENYENGTYFTNIEVFNSRTLKTSVKVQLTKHTTIKSTYIYNIVNEDFKLVDKNAVLDDPSLYYILDNGKYVSALSKYIVTDKNEQYYIKETTYIPVFYNCGSSQYGEIINNTRSDKKTILSVPKSFNIADGVYGIISDDPNLEINKSKVGTFNISRLYTVFQKNINGVGEYISNDSYITKPSPILLKNDIVYTGTGTYVWNPPTYNSFIKSDDDGKTYTIGTYISNDGYWKEIYDVKKDSFVVDAYLHNTSDGFSYSYNYIPNSYVVTAEIYHPEITYDVVTPYSKIETKYYSNYAGILREVKRENVFKNNGEYFGTYNGKLCKVIKYDYLVEGTTLEQHKLQDKHKETQIFTYKTSIELSNEHVPVLKETRLNPAVIKDISIYDPISGNTYSKSVVASYAYYSYEYMYETKPLIVSSYIVQTDDLKVKNLDNITTSIDNYTYNQDIISRNVINELKVLSNEISSSKSKQELTINNAVTNVTKTISNCFDGVDENISYTSKSINELNKNLSYVLNSNNDTTIKILSDVSEKLDNTLSSNLHSIAYQIANNSDNNSEVISKRLIDINKSLSYIGGHGVVRKKSTDVEYLKDDLVKSVNTDYYPAISSLSHLIDNVFTYKSSKISEVFDETGNKHTVINYSYNTIADILYGLAKGVNGEYGIPSKNEFVINLSSKLYSSIDFDTDIIDSVEYDEHGNITKKLTHKNNPYEIAKKSVVRASILWDELTKQNYV